MSCHIIMGKGSKQPHLHLLASACRSLASSLQISLHTAWVPRSLNQRADDISKQHDFDDWFLTNNFFQKVQTLFGKSFTLDAFADNLNTKVMRFFSKCWCPGTSGMDAFRQDWRSDRVLLVPPPRQLLQTLTKLRSDNSSGMLVYPECVSGLLLAAWNNSSLKAGKIAEWRFIGKGNLGANVPTRFNSEYDGFLTVVKLNYTK
jgi:hypothetical protein